MLLLEDLVQELSQVPSREVDLLDRVWYRVALIDGHCVRNSITRIEDCTRRSSRGKEAEDRLVAEVELGDFEGLEPNKKKLTIMLYSLI